MKILLRTEAKDDKNGKLQCVTCNGSIGMGLKLKELHNSLLNFTDKKSPVLQT